MNVRVQLISPSNNDRKMIERFIKKYSKIAPKW